MSENNEFNFGNNMNTNNNGINRSNIYKNMNYQPNYENVSFKIKLEKHKS